ncbi:MAG: hypothetical protein KA028_03050 [Candidatus Pacebacteria bacterium]|nr:hypothetical protein [Candidatus Paceibacterota bacterium]MBP9851648.1 hypothetical protein [Candidatus Paceibacterota bacterium]
MKHKPRTPLKELGLNDEKAPTGKYRAMVMIDSIPHQIGEDIADRMIAFAYTSEYNTSPMQPVQIFDDKGEMHIIDGKLKELLDDEDKGNWHRNEPPLTDEQIKNFEKHQKEK